MTTRSRPPVRLARAGGTATAAMLAMAMSGCSSDAPDAPDEIAYCVNAANEIVDEDLCDTDGDGGGGGLFFINHSSSHQSGLRPGTKLSGGTVFPYNDSAAREKLGLPRSGKIGAGGAGGTKISGSKIGGGGGGLFGGSGRGGGS